MSTSRRKFLKWMTAAGAALTIPKRAKGHEYFAGYPDSYAVLHDTTLCIGCRECEAACNEVNGLPAPFACEHRYPADLQEECRDHPRG